MTEAAQILDILALMQDRMATKEDVLKIRLDLESTIVPRLDALAEGQVSIRESLVPRSRVDELEDRVRFLESMIRQMSDELEILKKAQ